MQGRVSRQTQTAATDRIQRRERRCDMSGQQSGEKWTDEQKAVINARKGNLLVSAAAGSGKTAVLIEHILEKVC
ncbi:MAG: UvrD-helicase domain-containing protein, partial [Lachnospiraceae bacterium]|nr:UvrD-helicase domain-containing protein [Lachnospiraceae bacterium]